MDVRRRHRADEIQELVAIPTTTPEETLAAVVEFFAQHPVAAVGVGSFGPRFGTITTTPKVGLELARVAAGLAARHSTSNALL